MGNACDFDDYPSVFHVKLHKARKEHCCNECHRTILPGEQYEHVFGVWNGESGTYKICGFCLALRAYVTAHVPCFCSYYTQLRSNALGTLREYALEVPGLFFGGARLLLQGDHARGKYRRKGHAAVPR